MAWSERKIKMTTIYRVKYWYERPGGLPLGLRNTYKPNPNSGIPGAVRFYKDDSLNMTPAWVSYWKGLLKLAAPATWSSAQINAAYQSLTDKGRYATNFDSNKLMTITSGGNYVMGDDKPVSKAGQLWIKVYTLDSLKPPPALSVNLKTRPDVIQVAINERIAKLPDGTYIEEPFPQLGGNDVPVPLVAKNGFDWILAEAVEKVTAIGTQSYYNPARK